MNIQKAEIFGAEWYALSRTYPSDDAAARSFLRLMKAGERLQGELNIGCYRHGYGDGKTFFVTCVGTESDSLEFAGNMLGGREITLDGEIYSALVLRRMRKLVELDEQGAESGVHRFSHRDGVKLDWRGEEL